MVGPGLGLTALLSSLNASNIAVLNHAARLIFQVDAEGSAAQPRLLCSSRCSFDGTGYFI